MTPLHRGIGAAMILMAAIGGSVASVRASMDRGDSAFVTFLAAFNWPSTIAYEAVMAADRADRERRAAAR